MVHNLLAALFSKVGLDWVEYWDVAQVVCAGCGFQAQALLSRSGSGSGSGKEGIVDGELLQRTYRGTYPIPHVYTFQNSNLTKLLYQPPLLDLTIGSHLAEITREYGDSLAFVPSFLL